MFGQDGTRLPRVGHSRYPALEIGTQVRSGSWLCENARQRGLSVAISARWPRLVIWPSFGPFLSARAPDVYASGSLTLCFNVESVMEGDYALITTRSG